MDILEEEAGLALKHKTLLEWAYSSEEVAWEFAG